MKRHDRQIGNKTITVALAGAPNTGKVGFQPADGPFAACRQLAGKTIEQKTGSVRRGNLTMNIVDLPGTYSLTANSAENRLPGTIW